MLRTIRHALADDLGQGFVEYTLLLGIVAVAAVAGLTTFSNAINGELSKAATDI
jgi:Flp pilus assembly pilin Flp